MLFYVLFTFIEGILQGWERNFLMKRGKKVIKFEDVFGMCKEMVG